MNKVFIEDCRECWEWYPKDSLGIGSACGHEDVLKKISGKYIPRTLKEVGETTPIPDWCPKLLKQKAKEC